MSAKRQTAKPQPPAELEAEQAADAELELEQSGAPVEGRADAAAIGERLRFAADRDEYEAEENAEHEAALDTEPELDPVTKAIADANGRYIRAVVKALGPDQPIAPCSHCAGLGFNSLELKPDQHRARCDECDGRGAVDTGSRVEGQTILACKSCNGNGWRDVTPPLVVPRLELAATGEQPVYTPPIVPAAPQVVG